MVGVQICLFACALFKVCVCVYEGCIVTHVCFVVLQYGIYIMYSEYCLCFCVVVCCGGGRSVYGDVFTCDWIVCVYDCIYIYCMFCLCLFVFL